MVFLKILHVFGLMPKIFCGVIWLPRIQRLVCELLILKKECACLDTNTHTYTHTHTHTHTHTQSTVLELADV